MQQSYHVRVWEFGVLLSVAGGPGVLLAQRFLPRGPRGDLASGTLLVTGVSPRPDAAGSNSSDPSPG